MKITQKVAKTVHLLGVLGFALSAQAFQITNLSPQGEVAQAAADGLLRLSLIGGG